MEVVLRVCKPSTLLFAPVAPSERKERALDGGTIPTIKLHAHLVDISAILQPASKASLSLPVMQKARYSSPCPSRRPPKPSLVSDSSTSFPGFPEKTSDMNHGWEIIEVYVFKVQYNLSNNCVECGSLGIGEVLRVVLLNERVLPYLIECWTIFWFCVNHPYDQVQGVPIYRLSCSSPLGVKVQWIARVEVVIGEVIVVPFVILA
ncbi:hypothetical protein FGO68_gene4862 [Halteria grandinella]|uniref:Uncharacterized protein n=1 Tax=Halteria grandinella TaxID=5974 RepID=A0A8J8T2N4_HALGN|nr:hypothetical protein FGO68_gene4862 [Halteria grandinella]